MKNLDTIVERVMDISEDPAFVLRYLSDDLYVFTGGSIFSDCTQVHMIYAELPDDRFFIHGYPIYQDSDDFWKKEVIGFQGNLKKMLTGWQPKTFNDLLVLLSFYFCSSENKFISPPEPFPRQGSIVDDILSETRGYLLWTDQLERLIGIFEQNGKIRKELVRNSYGLRKNIFQEWASTKFLDNGLNLQDVVNERTISSLITAQPPTAIAYRLHKLLFSDESIFLSGKLK